MVLKNNIPPSRNNLIYMPRVYIQTSQYLWKAPALIYTNLEKLEMITEGPQHFLTPVADGPASALIHLALVTLGLMPQWFQFGLVAIPCSTPNQLHQRLAA